MNVVRSLFGGRPEQRAAQTISLEEYIGFFGYNGMDYMLQGGTSAAGREDIEASFRGYVESVYKANGVVFACMVARALLFSEARFQFRQRRNGRPGDLFGTPALKRLETPWAGGTTGDLLGRMIQDADVAGNSFTGSRGNTLVRLRPDWTTIVLGSRSGRESDTEVIGYAYDPGGPGSGEELEVWLPGQVAHFVPPGQRDPLARYRGMSWITPVLREVMSDGAANRHKLNFFEQGAKLGYVVTLDKDVAATPEKFAQWIEKFKHGHEGNANAYKTLFLAGGADVKIVGADLKQIDFAAVQGHGETRICAAARVPPIIVGLSEGLDSATYSNYGQARRAFADLTMRPMWRQAAGALAPLVDVPGNAELWYDDRDIPFLQEDMQDAATIQAAQAVTMRELVNAGFDPETVKLFVGSGDPSVLKHTGLVSVQLQPPGTVAQPALPAGDPPARSLADYIVQRAGRGERLGPRDVLAYIDSTAVELPPAA